MTTDLVGTPFSKDIESAWMRDAESPGSWRSGCLMVAPASEVMLRAERIDWVSEPASLGVKVGALGIRMGVNGGLPLDIAVPASEPVLLMAILAKLELTGLSGLGSCGGALKNMVFLTWLASLLPRFFLVTVFCARNVEATLLRAASASSSSS